MYAKSILSEAHLKRVTVVMPPELHKRLKFLSIQCDTTMNDLILRSVEKYLSKTGYEKDGLGWIDGVDL